MYKLKAGQEFELATYSMKSDGDNGTTLAGRDDETSTDIILQVVTEDTGEVDPIIEIDNLRDEDHVNFLVEAIEKAYDIQSEHIDA